MEEEVKDKIQEVTDAVETAAEDVKETVETSAQETKDTFQDKVAAVKEAVQEKAAGAKEAIQEKAAGAMDDVKEVATGVAEEAQQIKEELQAPKEEAPKAAATAPANQLPTGRGLLKWIFLGLITLGIYNLIILTKMSGEINTVASRHDGKSTMNYCLLVFIITGLTLGIGQIVWWHRICNRLGNELKRRGIDFEISAKTWWGWNVLGALIGIGPWVFIYKFCKGFNLMNADYNQKG